MNAPTDQQPATKKSPGLTGAQIAANLFVASLFFVGIWAFFFRLPSSPAYTVTAAQIIEDYNANEMAAQAKYGDKRIRVSGSFTTSGFSLGQPWIILDGARNALASVSGVRCHFKRGDESKIATLTPGQQVTVEGKVLQKIGFVQLHKCRF